MDFKQKNIYPSCETINRTFEVGGLSKRQLIQKLKQNSILLNKFAEQLLADDHFTVSDKVYSIKTVELTVRNLGFPEGGILAHFYRKAIKLGLKLCPLELAPYVRLAYQNQSDGNLNRDQQHKAPYVSITIASRTLTEDDKFPKGFYLRKVDGILWLRGYVCDDTHIWEPDDRFIFVK